MFVLLDLRNLSRASPLANRTDRIRDGGLFAAAKKSAFSGWFAT